MTYDELKQKAKDELSKAIAEKEQLIERLQRSFDDIDKFQKGNIIVCHYNDYLIVGQPISEGKFLKIPVRHNIYPEISLKDCSMNMSGVVDILKIPISKIEDVKVMTAKEWFSSNRCKLLMKLSDDAQRDRIAIDKCKKSIEDIKKRIEQLEQYIKDYESFDFNGSFEQFVDTYLESERFAEYVYNVKETSYTNCCIDYNG